MSAPLDSRSARARWKELAPQLEGRPLVALSATWAVEPLVPLLGAALDARGWPMRVAAARFNNLHQELLDREGLLARAEHVVLLPRLEELVGRDGWSERSVRAAVEDLIAAVRAWREHAAGRLWLGLFPTPHLPRATDDLPGGRSSLWYAANQRLIEAAAPLGSARVIDVSGHLRGHDDRMWFLAGQPYDEASLCALGGVLARRIVASARPPKKVLALDCDGVLWGGVVGEDGPEGIRVGSDPVGRGFAALQEVALELRSRGVLLALCSKNNPEDVWAAFGRDEMVLSREHVSTVSIGWHTKSQGLREIAAALHVGVDSVVLIDDNPAEIAEVQANLPQATALLVPTDVAKRPRWLSDLDLFDADQVTDEDRHRASMIAAEAARDDAAARLAPEDFLKGLGLAVTVRSVRPEVDAFERVVQLLHKTNQFNLTTRRHTAAELGALLDRDGWECLTVSVRDRFGEYGLTGVAVGGPEGGDYVIDTLLLSCRVLGRAVEQALMAALVERARQLGCSAIRAWFLPTAKNAPAAPYLSAMGFEAMSATEYRLRVDATVPGWPTHIERG